jgi:hypothetical protein
MIDSRVMVSRLGEVTIPVTVLIHFSNGEEQREWWDGQERTVEFTYRRPVGVLWARVDPDMVLAIDVNVVNNSKTVEESPAPIWNYTGKFLFWIQHLLQCAAILG